MRDDLSARIPMRILAAFVLAACSGAAAAQVYDPHASAAVVARMNLTALGAQSGFDRFIVYYRDGSGHGAALPASVAASTAPAARTARLQVLGGDLARVSAALGVKLAHVRGLATGGELVGVQGQRLPAAAAQRFMTQMLANPDVAYVEPDRRMTIKMVPNDAYW